MPDATHGVCCGVRGGALLEHCFFLKAVRWRLSKHNGGLLQFNGAAGLHANAVRQDKRWLSSLLENKSSTPRRHRPASAALMTDASLYGWGALLLKGGGEVCVPGGVWDREPQCTSQSEARAVLLALSSFAEVTPKNLRICIGNTTVMNVMKKGNAHCAALVHERSRINKALQEQCAQASCACIASGDNPADGISRGNRFWHVDIAKGWWMRRGAWKTR
ncbi:putative serine/threonine protein phosphatase [Trypanosoma vivax]|nr:putative serine/threonine protein phosphatase [Trypanosoma vivax]